MGLRTDGLQYFDLRIGKCKHREGLHPSQLEVGQVRT